MGFLPTKKSTRISLSWIRYTSRSPSFAQSLGARHFFVAERETVGPFKYLFRAVRSFWLLVTLRPSLVITMNPPVFNPFVAWLYTLLFDADLMIDCHSGAFNHPMWRRFARLNGFLIRNAILCVVHNERELNLIRELGGRGVVVADLDFRLPQGDYTVNDGFTVCLVSLYAFDEPLDAVWEAARNLPGVTVYVTGDSRRATPALLRTKPSNVVLTGFLDPEAYGALVNNVSAVMALTTRDNTMQRGGSEAMSAGKPLVTSDSELLRSVFHKGAVFCDNAPKGIEQALIEIQERCEVLEKEMKELREERAEKYQSVVAEIEEILASSR